MQLRHVLVSEDSSQTFFESQQWNVNANQTSDPSLSSGTSGCSEGPSAEDNGQENGLFGWLPWRRVPKGSAPHFSFLSFVENSGCLF